MSDNKFTLYYFQASYYSQKAVLALFEKGCPFNRKIINIQNGEQRTPEYMKMNPQGLVPLLKDGEKIVVESEKIIDYVDDQVKSGPTLVPDPSTSVGKEVKRLREFIDAIRIEIVTYGLLFNPELSISGIKIPKMLSNVKRINEKMQKNIASLEEAAQEYPDLRDSYIAKYQKTKKFYEDTVNKENVIEHLEDTDHRCEYLEECLRRSKESSGGGEYWLTGTQFNAADILLVVFMDRIVMLGLEDRYFCKTKRPLLYDYLQRIGQRKSVQMLRADVKTAITMVMWNAVKAAVPYVVGIGLAIGAGVWLMKNRSRVINAFVEK
ncbi:GDAP1 [Mytilus edulis]|uniref:GDAP1 n=1 Tax=Mytilus edulis TaxID=6550 RepID=A0A8S3RJJ6_MYTED|nr:GDAP1 [Mytilus edulis]